MKSSRTLGHSLSECSSCPQFGCCVCLTHVFVFRYEMVLQQTVGTEDLFLGLSRKDPSSTSCEAMLVSPENKNK